MFPRFQRLYFIDYDNACETRIEFLTDNFSEVIITAGVTVIRG